MLTLGAGSASASTWQDTSIQATRIHAEDIYPAAPAVAVTSLGKITVTRAAATDLLSVNSKASHLPGSVTTTGSGTVITLSGGIVSPPPAGPVTGTLVVNVNDNEPFHAALAEIVRFSEDPATGGLTLDGVYADAPSPIIYVNLAGAVQFTEPYVMLKPPGAPMLDPAPSYSFTFPGLPREIVHSPGAVPASAPALRPARSRHLHLDGQDLAAARRHHFGCAHAPPLGGHDEQRGPAGPPQSAGEATPVQLDDLQHLAALGHPHAPLSRHIGVPDRALRIGTDAVGTPSPRSAQTRRPESPPSAPMSKPASWCPYESATIRVELSRSPPSRSGTRCRSATCCTVPSAVTRETAPGANASPAIGLKPAPFT